MGSKLRYRPRSAQFVLDLLAEMLRLLEIQGIGPASSDWPGFGVERVLAYERPGGNWYKSKLTRDVS